MKRARLQGTACVLAAVLLFVFAVPLPHRVYCLLEVKPRNAETIYVEVPGRLDEVKVKSGQHVVKGEILARLTNIDVDLAIADLAGKQEQYNARLLGLRHAGSADEAAIDEIPHLRKTLQMVEEQLEEKRADYRRLVLKSPVDGTVMPPPATPDRPESPGQLKGWYGTPLDKRNVGATLSDSTLFCEIGNPCEMEANLVIEQDDIEFIHEGQPVAIKLDEFPHRTFKSKIEEIAKIDLKVTPRHLSNKSGGEVITKTDESGAERPQNTSYQARAPLDDQDGMLTVGLKGRAKIHTRWQTLGFRAWRYLTRTFNFKL